MESLLLLKQLSKAVAGLVGSVVYAAEQSNKGKPGSPAESHWHRKRRELHQAEDELLELLQARKAERTKEDTRG